MRKKIRRYNQTDIRRCGPACMLMLLDLHEKLRGPKYPTVVKEKQLYGSYCSKVKYPDRDEFFPGVNGAAMAKGLTVEGLRVHLVHSSENMMDNRDGYFQKELFDALLKEYRERVAECADSVRVTTGAQITCETLREELDAGRQIILETIVPGDADLIHDRVLHWIVVYGYEGDLFKICDPNYKRKTTLTSGELEHYMDTPIGKIYLAVSGEETP